MEGKAKKPSIFLLIMVIVMLVMALFTFFWEIINFITAKTVNSMNLILSSSSIALSIYILLQIRERSKSIIFEPSRVITVLRCENCDYSSAREFEKGDYVLKEIGVCPKCNGPLIIYSIFREVKAKEG